MPPLPAGKTFSDVYDVILLVDNREQFSRAGRGRGRHGSLADHVEVIRSRGIRVETRCLAIGDALWIARRKSAVSNGQSNENEEFVLDYIVERKRVDDLWASIVDGRYRRQKYVMRQAGVANMVYLSEGNVMACDNSQAIRTALLQTRAFDGFSVFSCGNLLDVFGMYVYLTENFVEKYEAAGADGSTQPMAQTFAQFTRRVRNEQASCNTVKHILGMMLSVIRGIGPQTAARWLSDHASPKSLIWSLRRIDRSNPRLRAADKKIIAAFLDEE